MARAETRSVDALAPDLIWAEVAAALRRHVRTRRLPQQLANDALVRLLRLPVAGIGLRLLAPAAAHLSQLHDMSTYDAFYLALAEASGGTLVTADRRLAALAASAAFLT
jgi:predicted nucleic acid-binding protein